MNIKSKLILPTKYRLGFENWDDQHLKIISLLQEAVECKKKKGVYLSQELEVIFKSLLQYSRMHFEYEESKMIKMNYDASEDHIKEHRFFLEKVNQMYKMKRNEQAVSELINFLTSWFYVHIQKIDRKFAEAVMQDTNSKDGSRDLPQVSKVALKKIS